MKNCKVFVIFYLISILFGSLCESLRNNDYKLSDNTKKNISNQLKSSNKMEVEGHGLRNFKLIQETFQNYFKQKYLKTVSGLDRNPFLSGKHIKAEMTPEDAMDYANLLFRLAGPQELQLKLLFKKEKTESDTSYLDLEVSLRLFEGLTIINGKTNFSNSENTATQNESSSTKTSEESYCTVQIILDPEIPLYKKLQLPSTITVKAEFKASDKLFNEVKMKIDATDGEHFETLGYGLVKWDKQ